MKKRILCLLLVMLMLVSALTALTACGGGGGGGDDEDLCANGHTYTKANGRCDVCKKKCKHDFGDDNVCDLCKYVKSETAGEDYPEVPWADEEPVELVFMMTNNTSGDSLPSGCNRYLAGGDQRKDEAIDTEVETRNSEAEWETNVKLEYKYYTEHTDYGWGNCYELIASTVGSNGAPDMFCNFTYDMVAASLRSSFANLRDTTLDQGNFFSFLDEDYNESVDNRGYMYEYMTSVTLSKTKMYILASDYFLDLIRAFYIVPVNVELLTKANNLNGDKPPVTGDLDGSGDFTIDDFYMEVWQKKWDYNKVADYSAAVYQQGAQSTLASEDINDVLGFVVHTGYVSSGMIYSTDITVIERSEDKDGNPVYKYPESSPKLEELFTNAIKLVNSTGVYVIGADDDKSYENYGKGGALAVRARFCTNNILFGGIIMLGGLEFDEYQTLKDSSGFGVVPVPFYHTVAEDSEERYLTSIHNAARPGAIARSTKNFTACTAFLDYQSTHSTDILNNYYDRNLCVSVVDGRVEGTVDMLQYIRKNVRTAFDKTFEDALGVYNNDSKIRWSWILECKAYMDPTYDIRGDYDAYAPLKQGYLKTLYDQYMYVLP